MLEFFVASLGLVLLCSAAYALVLLAQAVSRQKPTHRRRAQMGLAPTRHYYRSGGRSNPKQAMALGISISVGIMLYSAYAHPVTPTIPPPPVSGPGLVPVSIGNAGPQTMTIVFKSATEQYRVVIPPCPTCQVYVTKPPLQCPADTVYESFALKPDLYEVQVQSNGGSPYSDQLNLTNVPTQKNCFFTTYSPDDRRMQGERTRS